MSHDTTCTSSASNREKLALGLGLTGLGIGAAVWAASELDEMTVAATTATRKFMAQCSHTG